MIKSENDVVKIEGYREDLINEFMCIAHTLLSKKVASSDLLITATTLAVLPKEEVKEMMIKAIDEMDDIGTALNLLGALEYSERSK